MSYYENQQSERLLFRKLTEDDIPTWSSFFIDNDRTRFVGSHRFTHLDHVGKATNWIRNQMERYHDHDFGQLAVIEKETGKMIGVSGIIPREIDEKKEYEITYSLLPSAWNKGFASEAAIHFKEYAFANINCDSVISIIHVENEPSGNVARKNGMRKVLETEYMEMPVYVYRIMNDKR